MTVTSKVTVILTPHFDYLGVIAYNGPSFWQQRSSRRKLMANVTRQQLDDKDDPTPTWAREKIDEARRKRATKLDLRAKCGA